MISSIISRVCVCMCVFSQKMKESQREKGLQIFPSPDEKPNMLVLFLGVCGT